MIKDNRSIFYVCSIFHGIMPGHWGTALFQWFAVHNTLHDSTSVGVLVQHTNVAITHQL